MRLIPAPWTSPMMTSESAGNASAGTRERSGRCGHGSARGMGAMSPTTATEGRPTSATASVMITSASAMAKSLKRVRRSRTTSTTVVKPIAVVGTSDPLGCMNRSAALSTLLSYWLEKPVSAPSCDSRMVTPMPAMSPIITALEMNRTSPPALRRPRTQHDGAGEHRQSEQARHALLGREGGQRSAGRKAQRRGRDDRHALGAGSEGARRGTGRDGVQAVDRRARRPASCTPWRCRPARPRR